MKKVILSLSLTIMLILTLTIIVLVQVTKPKNYYLSISDYNNTYKQAQDDTMLSLDEYNEKYAK
ncbi:hypothetical protein [Anaerosporobacter sp.]